jgi:large subunit ribosomal protein L30
MIAVIRITGQVGLNEEIVETLNRLRLKRKYVCVVLEKPTKEQISMIKNVRDFVAYGEIDEKTHKELVEKRGKKDAEGKLKPFFRLHPPRKGINSKIHFPKGVLGDNKEKINELIARML